MYKLCNSTMNNKDTIIKEAIESVINEKKGNSDNSDISKLIKSYLSKKPKNKKKKKRLRRTRNGGKVYYDYGDYERRNKKISKGDAMSIIHSVDMEKTNIAAVARELFPDHTEEGAQSQLRKMLKGERPFTKSLASKLEKMISAGQVAVK